MLDASPNCASFVPVLECAAIVGPLVQPLPVARSFAEADASDHEVIVSPTLPGSSSALSQSLRAADCGGVSARTMSVHSSAMYLFMSIYPVQGLLSRS